MQRRNAAGKHFGEPMNELIHIPLIGDVAVWKYVLSILALFLGADKIKVAFSYVLKFFPKLSPLFGSFLHAGNNEQALDKTLDAALASLQALTLWGVRNASPELLKQITDLYAELKKLIHASDGLNHPEVK
jgi:hypothetical protein